MSVLVARVWRGRRSGSTPGETRRGLHEIAAARGGPALERQRESGNGPVSEADAPRNTTKTSGGPFRRTHVRPPSDRGRGPGVWAGKNSPSEARPTAAAREAFMTRGLFL